MSHHLTDLIVADGVEDVDSRLPDVSDGAEIGCGEGSVEPAVGEERHEDHERARQRHDVPQHRPDRHDDGAHLGARYGMRIEELIKGRRLPENTKQIPEAIPGSRDSVVDTWGEGK